MNFEVLSAIEEAVNALPENVIPSSGNADTSGEDARTFSENVNAFSENAGTAEGNDNTFTKDAHAFAANGVTYSEGAMALSSNVFACAEDVNTASGNAVASYQNVNEKCINGFIPRYSLQALYPSTMAKAGQRPVAVFNYRKHLGIANFILKVRAILLEIAEHPGSFVSPLPALPVVSAHVDELIAAEAVAGTRVQGAAAARDVRYQTVLADVNSLLSYVQTLADNATDTLHAFAIISASGFSIKDRGVQMKPPLAAKNGKEAGSILLTARGAGKRDFHEWAMSNNANNWTQLPSTVKAKTEVTGLTRLTTVYFRHRIITKDGPQSWGNPVSIVVL